MTQTEERTEVSGCVLQMGRGQRRQWPIDLTDNLSVFPLISSFSFSLIISNSYLIQHLLGSRQTQAREGEGGLKTQGQVNCGT